MYLINIQEGAQYPWESFSQAVRVRRPYVAEKTARIH